MITFSTKQSRSLCGRGEALARAGGIFSAGFEMFRERLLSAPASLEGKAKSLSFAVRSRGQPEVATKKLNVFAK